MKLQQRIAMPPYLTDVRMSLMNFLEADESIPFSCFYWEHYYTYHIPVKANVAFIQHNLADTFFQQQQKNGLCHLHSSFTQEMTFEILYLRCYFVIFL